MNAPRSQTIENVLFERMGVSVEDAFAIGADLVDAQISKAGEAGVDVESRLSGFLGLLLQLTDPQSMKALQTLIERLPRLAELAKRADEVPSMIAAFGDAFDDFQQRCESDGIDLERSMVNGLHAALWLGCQIDKEDLSRIGELLRSDILSHGINPGRRQRGECTFGSSKELIRHNGEITRWSIWVTGRDA